MDDRRENRTDNTVGALHDREQPTFPGKSGAQPPEGGIHRTECYPAQKGFMRALRLSASLPPLLGIALSMALVILSDGREDAAGLVLAALGAQLASLGLLLALIPTIHLCNADNWLLLRTGGTLWRVGINQLNLVDTCRFTDKSGAVRALRWDLLDAGEQRRAVDSALRAMEMIGSGKPLRGSVLSRAVVPLTGLAVERETRWCWRVTYQIQGGGRRRLSIPKAYPGFAPAPGLEPPQAPVPARWGLCVGGLLAVLLMTAGGGAMGLAVEGGLERETGGAGDSIEARVPDSMTVYELGPATCRVDAGFEPLEAGILFDPQSNTFYLLAARSGVDENEALDFQLGLIEKHRMQENFDSFRFESADSDFVPLTAADGTVYRYNMLSLYFAGETGEAAIHSAVALSEEGVLVTAQAAAETWDNEEEAKGTILSILESIEIPAAEDGGSP